MPSLLSNIILPFMPPIRTAKAYSLFKLRRDLLAGLTVSVVEIPQAMAYALIAGVPPQYGIYTSIIQGIIGALLSSSEHMTTGPTNTQSLLIASAVSRLANPTADPALYLQMVIALTFLKGLIQLSFAAARMGDMVRYVSRSVIVGLTAGAGVLIAVGQLPATLGIDTSGVTRHLAGVLGRVEALIGGLHQFNPRALVITLVCMALILIMRRFSRLLPGSLLAVILSALAIGFMGWSGQQVPLIGPLPSGFPHFQVPALSWSTTESLFGGALALALLGMLESVSIAKSIAIHTNERISANQEFFAQGFKNLLSSFLQCIPGSGSFTRSALDHAAGAQTRFAAVFNALFVAAIFFLGRSFAASIPLASLAAILLVIAWGLIDFGYIPRMFRSSRSDAVVCLITFAATLLAPLEYAIFIGVLLNIALYLRAASRLQVSELVDAPSPGTFIERPLRDRYTGTTPVVFLQLEGNLFFAVADELQDRLSTLVHSDVRIVILRLKRTHGMDATVLGIIERFVGQMRQRDAHVLLCGVKPELYGVLESYGLVRAVGQTNVFKTAEGIFTSSRQALERARLLLGHSIDITDLDIDDSDEFIYHI